MRNSHFLQDIYIVGATSSGRELESAIDNTPYMYRRHRILGYLHSYKGSSPFDKYPSDYKILGSWEDYPLKPTDNCIIAVTEAEWKRKLYYYLKDRCGITGYIHYSAGIGKFVTVGEGSMVTRDSVISSNVQMGTMVFVNGGSQVGHDVKIGDFSTVYSGVQIGGRCEIGKDVMIGSGAIIVPGIKIGDGATIGTGSVVVRNVKPGITVFGNPAKKF